MNRPIELIIANTIHDTLQATSMMSVEARDVLNTVKTNGQDPLAEACARSLLIAIASTAGLHYVFDALKAVGRPASQSELAHRIAAAEDACKPKTDEPRARPTRGPDV